METRKQSAVEKKQCGLNCAQARQIMNKFQERNGATQCKLLKGIGTGKVLRECSDSLADAAELLETNSIANAHRTASTIFVVSNARSIATSGGNLSHTGCNSDIATGTHQPNTNLPDKLVWAGIPKTPAGKKHIETPHCDVSTIFMREWKISLPSACGIGNPASLYLV